MIVKFFAVILYIIFQSYFKKKIVQIKNEQLDRIFFSLSDNHRRCILSMLVYEDLKVGDIAVKANLSLASASKHIQVLVSCELIIQKKAGREKICQANLSRLSEASVWLRSVGLLDLLDTSRLEAFLSKESLI